MELAAILVVVSAAGFAATLTLWVAMNARANTANKRLQAATYAQAVSELDVTTEKPLTGWFGYWQHLYDEAGRAYPKPRTPGWVAILIIALTGFIGIGVFPTGIIGAAVPAVAIFGWKATLNIAAKRRLALIDKQLPLLISSLRANLHSGATPQQALLNVADEIPPPLGLEIQKLRQSVHVAVSLEDALKELSRSIPSREVSFLAASIEIAVRSGADLGPQLAVIDEIITQRTRLQQKLASAIAATQPTKIAVLLGTAFFALISIGNPDYHDFWFSIYGVIAGFVVVVLTMIGLIGFKTLTARVENS